MYNLAAKTLEDAQSKANTHTVLSFDKKSTRFLVEKRQNPREVRPPGRFAVCLDEFWCDCEKFQYYIYHALMCLLHANMHTMILLCTSL